MDRLSGFFWDKDGNEPNGRSYALAYLVLTHIFFWKVLVPGRMLFGTDIMNQSYPIQHMAVEHMKKDGSLMLWNPYIFSGMPFLASFSFPFFYPLAALFFVLPLGFAMGYEIVIHTFLMGLFMYVFLRHLRLGRQAAFVGGLLFMFNCHLISLIYPGHGGKLFTMTYLPLALMFLDRALDGKAFYNMTMLGLMVGLMFYGGHIQILFYCGITLTLFLAARLAAGLREKGVLWAAKGAAGFAAAFALGALLYASILLPAWEYRGFTQRGGGLTGASSYQFATSFSQPPEDMLYLALRNPFGWGKDYGSGTPNTKDIFYRGRVGLRLSIDYFGVFGLVLAFVGAAAVRNRYTWFFLGLALISGFLALGQFNPYYVYVYKYIPGFSVFRVPYAIMILMPLCLSVLAAYGLQRLIETPPAGDRFLGRLIYGGAALGALVLAVAVYWRANIDGVGGWLIGHQWVRQMLWEDYSDLPVRINFFVKNLLLFVIVLSAAMVVLFAYRKGLFGPRRLAWVAAAFILMDIWPVGWDFVHTVPTSQVETQNFRETPQIKAVKADKEGPFRVFSLVNNNELLYRDIESLTGYHAVVLGYYEALLDRADFTNQVLDMLNAKYLMLPKEVGYDFRSYPDLSARDRLSAKYQFISDDGMYFYRSRTAMPRAWLVGRMMKANDWMEALGILSDPQFDPASTVVLKEDLPDDAIIDPAVSLAGQRVVVTPEGTDAMRINISAPANSFLVISEVWYPGWEALLDGKETHIYRADYALRGVYVTQGDHALTLRFRPPRFRAGTAISVLALCFLAGVIAWPSCRERVCRKR